MVLVRRPNASARHPGAPAMNTTRRTPRRRPELAAAIDALEPRTLFATLPAGFAVSQVLGNLTSPTAMEVAPDGRLFIAEQDGRLRVFKNGALLTTPFLTVPAHGDGEDGLLG